MDRIERNFSRAAGSRYTGICDQRIDRPQRNLACCKARCDRILVRHIHSYRKSRAASRVYCGRQRFNPVKPPCRHNHARAGSRTNLGEVGAKAG